VNQDSTASAADPVPPAGDVQKKKGDSMKKVTVLMAAAFVTLMGTLAHAETCYKLQPFVDVLRLNVQITEGGPNSMHEAVYGDWVTGSYTLPVVGARELNVNSTSQRRLGIHGTNDTASFGSNPACVLDGIPNGAWTLSCFGGGSGRFSNHGTSLTPISCSSLPPEVGPEAGTK
jgi:hypothetical protein